MSELPIDVDALQEEVKRLREELAAAEREQDRLMFLADPFRVDYWPFRYNWRTVDADGTITYHKCEDSPVLVSGKWWYSECSDLHGKMNLLAQDDYRNSLRARPVEKKG